MTESASKQLYLICGFLGSGKTTLMRHLISLYADRRIAVIVNEFGKQGVDGTLLAQTGVQVEEISNGSIFCVCRSDRFAEVLAQALDSDAELVLVEASGLADPTGMKQILNTVTEATGKLYDFCGTVALVDSAQLLKLHQNVAAVKQQVLSAGLIVINKTDITPPDTLAAALALIAELNPVARVCQTSFARVERSWMDELRVAQQRVKGPLSRHTLGVKSMLVMVEGRPECQRFAAWLKGISAETYRVKGFVDLAEGRHLVDCVSAQVTLSPAGSPGPSCVVILMAGNDKSVKRISALHREIFDTDIVFG